MKLRVLTSVHLEAVRITEYYERRQTGLGVRFLDRLDEALESIEQNPSAHPRLESVSTDRNIRRVVRSGFPYLAIFEIVADEAVVIALRHGSQEPGVGIPGSDVDARK